MGCLIAIYALDDPKMSSNDWLKQIFFLIDLGIWIFFVLEMVLRIIIVKYIDGLQGFHLLSMFFDTAILIMGILNFVGYSHTTLGMVGKSLKVVVVFTKLPFVKHIVKYLLLSIRPIVGIYFYLVVFYFCFAVVFVRYEGGANQYCSTENIPSDLVYPGMDRSRCTDLGGDWLNYAINFDDVFQAWRALFVMSTGDGWVNQLWKDFDPNSIIKYNIATPLPQFIQMRWIYILFMVLFYFLLLDVFTGTIIQEYYKQKNAEYGIGQLNPQQLHWVYLQKMILELRPEVKFKTRNICGFLSSSFFTHHKTKFELLQLMIYMTFTIIWSTASYPMDTTSTHYQIISAAYSLFVFIWFVEILMTIYIKRSKYFKSLYHLIEIGHFAVCCVLMVKIFTDYGIFNSKKFIDTRNVSSAARMRQNDRTIQTFRCLLILRAMTAVRFFYNIPLFKKIIRIFLYILPSFSGMIMLILLIIFIFSCIGYYGFTYTSFGPDSLGISKDANFSTFFTSFATLFRVCFADNWSSILESLTLGLEPNHVCREFESNHENYEKYGLTRCGLGTAGFVYLYAFYTAVNFIFFNILVALVLDSFEVAYQQEATVVQRSTVEQFVAAWKESDHEANTMIKVTEIVPLLKRLEYPLSLPKTAATSKKLQYLAAQLAIPVYARQSKTSADAKKTADKQKVEYELSKKASIKDLVDLAVVGELYYNFHDVLLALSHHALITNDSREYKE